MNSLTKIKFLATSCLAAVALPAYSASIVVSDSVDAAGITYDLTNEFGTLDWAYNAGGEINTKDGGNLISGFGGPQPENDGDQSIFSFTDGTDPVSGTVTADYINNDFTASVAAPFAGSFTIYFWATVAGATGNLEATIGGVTDSATYSNSSSNRPGRLFTIDVVADNAGQTVDLNYFVSDTGAAWHRVHTSAIGVVPEPSSAALLAGMFGFVWVMLRRRA